MTELCDLPATDQLALLESSEASASEMLESHLARIDAVNPALNAVVSMDAELARSRAAEIDESRSAGDPVGPLAGLVTAHKDLAETVDFPTTYGSPLYLDYRPAADNIVVARMKAAGAVAVGKTNTPEFGAGSHTFNPVHGVTANAYDQTKTAGGSSGGAAVALASHMVSIADGSDLGGSLRNPAAWNNVVGFRASLGRVANSGVGNAWIRHGIAGAMGRTVDDLTLLLGVLTPFDVSDPMSRPMDVSVIDPVDKPLRIAWSADIGGLPVESDVRVAMENFRGDVEGLGWEIEDSEPSFEGADECFATLRSWSFATGQLSEFPPEDVAKMKGTVQEELAKGRELSAVEVGMAMNHLKTLWDRAVAFFAGVDLLIGPVTQLSPFDINEEYPGAVDGVPNERYIDWMKSCCRITVMGLPALSLPAGFTEEGLPVGAQLIGGPWADLDVLRAAKTIESATNYGSRRPSIIE